MRLSTPTGVGSPLPVLVLDRASSEPSFEVLHRFRGVLLGELRCSPRVELGLDDAPSGDPQANRDESARAIASPKDEQARHPGYSDKKPDDDLPIINGSHGAITEKRNAEVNNLCAQFTREAQSRDLMYPVAGMT
jgi:hypothetical protein